MKKRTKTIWERVVVLFCALALFLCGLAVPVSAEEGKKLFALPEDGRIQKITLRYLKDSDPDWVITDAGQIGEIIKRLNDFQYTRTLTIDSTTSRYDYIDSEYRLILEANPAKGFQEQEMEFSYNYLRVGNVCYYTEAKGCFNDWEDLANGTTGHFAQYADLELPEYWPYSPTWGKPFRVPLAGGLLFCSAWKSSELGDHVVIFEARGLKGDVVIPETIRGMPVTTILSRYDHTTMGQHYFAFALCDDITSLTLPASLVEISSGEYTLGGKNVREIVFSGDGPQDLSLGTEGFPVLAGAEKIERLVLPKKVRSFILPDFTNLKEIVLSPENPYFVKDGSGIIYNKDKTKLVTAAENAANRREITLPGTVKEIETGGLSGCVNLQRIYGGAHVKKMQSDELDACTDLNPFEDTYGRWHEEYAKWAFQNDLFAGITPFTFGPDQKMTRGMFAAVLYRLEGEPKISGNAPFADVRNDAYYTQAVNWAAQEGIVYGTTDKTFSPEKSLTREQMVSILYRYAEKKGEKYNTALWGDLAAFTDSGKITAYAKDAFNWAVGAGIVSGKGDGTLDPQGTATRAEVAAVLKNLVEK